MEQSKRSARSPIVIVYVGHRHEEFRQEFGRFGLLSYLLPESARQHPVKRLGVVDHNVVNEHSLPQIEQDLARNFADYTIYFHAFG